MQLQFILPPEISKDGIIHFKNYLYKASIEGLSSLQIDRKEHSEGQMGAGDIINSVTALIEALTQPLTELVKTLHKYAENYRTRITIPTKDGNIEISHGKSMTADELQKIITAIQFKTK